MPDEQYRRRALQRIQQQRGHCQPLVARPQHVGGTDIARADGADVPQPGGAGLATLLGVTLARVQEGDLTLPQALALLTAKPAAWLGIETGVLAKGRPADLCLFDPEKSWQVQAGKLPGKAQNTPFDGRALEGVVLGTRKAGRRAYG